MARLMLHKNILKNFRDLPLRVQKNVADMVERFQVNPNDPAIHLHGLKETMVDPKVRGANLPDGYRAIIIAPEKGDTFLMMHIAKHDEAYKWAQNKRFEVHPQTGVFQIFDVEEIQEQVPHAKAGSPKQKSYPIQSLTDDDIFAAGVPRQLIPAVRAVDSDEGLESLAPYLPADCREVLFGIAAGMNLDEAIESTLGSTSADLAEKRPVSTGDFTRIAESPSFDLVLIEDQAELREAMTKPLTEWRLFLHPSQRKIVNWDVKGPMSVNGAAGTGKTVAMLHRAVRLAKQLKVEADRVLVTTYTTNLSHTLEDQIKQLDPNASSHIEVTNLHALARSICIRTGWKGAIADDSDTDEVWTTVLDSGKWGDLPLKPDDIKNEYRVVIDRNGIEDEDSYLTAVRTGLPRMTRDTRRSLWPLFLEFQRELKRRNLLTFEGAVHQARLSCEKGAAPRYVHVLVDEVQDFGLEALRLIRALVPDVEGALNPLTLFGDGHQRIYGAKIPLSRAGIEVRGRSRRLKLNYRTSEEIRRWAHGILKGVEVDDLNGNVASTVGDRSAFKYMNPEVRKCSSEKDEAKQVATWAKELLDSGKYASHEICVTPNSSSLRKALHEAGVPTRELKAREVDPGEKEPGVRLGSMRRIKGLEFRAVAMACLSDGNSLSDGADVDPRERALRYVAATRARERLLVTTSGSAADRSADSPAGAKLT